MIRLHGEHTEVLLDVSGGVPAIVHWGAPLLASKAETRPRTPNSPPEMPAITISLPDLVLM